MKIKPLLSQIYNSKIIELIIKGIFIGIFAFIVIAFIFYGYLFIVGIFFGSSVLIEGDKSMINGKVYINNKHEANMIWDEELNRTYARDLWTLGIFDITSGRDKYGIPADTMKLRKRYGDIEIKVITQQDVIYIQRYYDLEDLSYNSYNIKDFEEAK